MTIDEKINDGILHYNINRQAEKVSTFSLGNLVKY